MKQDITVEQLPLLRHSLAHLLGAAIMELYPTAKLTLGPAIDNGFYYDAQFEESISSDALPALEQKMQALLPTWKSVTHKEVSKDEALAHYEGNIFKTELINEIADRNEKITLYTMGNFVDLCRGGHIDDLSTIDSGSFKLDRVAGAYWRGDEKKPMLTRIYGLAFENKEALEKYEWQQEEAKKRDHRKLGKELKLFTISPLVGSGLPLFQPNGMIIRKELEDYLWQLHSHRGYSRVWTPHVAKETLYETSGHAGHYMEDMFTVFGGTSKEKFYLKPMNCPHHMQLFADNQFSYRDMPVRYFEPATVYRDEKTGQLSGLTRVRSITQDDGHLFCRASQVGEEIKTIVAIIKEFYTTMGMIDSYKVRLSLRDDDKSKWLGSDEVWNTAESALKEICTSEQLPYFEGPGEAAFYGPKLDFIFNDAIGREWQLATIQCDFNLPERFDLAYTNEKGEQERPVVIHRAISGSLERFMGVMIEHFSGSFPTWIAPIQVAIIPVRDTHIDAAHTLKQLLQKSTVRSEIYDDNSSLGKRIHAAKSMHAPYIVVLGDKEIEAGVYSVELRDGSKLSLRTEEFITRLEQEIKMRA
jgi:threonyl-tRNA synthetase